jgi:aryl-alcohol dehydrogenase-like predicted oxidoreductase
LEELDDIAGASVRSVERSLERLGLESVELVHLHNRVGSARAAKPDVGVGALLTVDDVLGPNGVLDGLRTLKKRKLIQFFGCCSYGGEMRRVRALIDSGAFDNMLVHYNMLNPTAWTWSADGDARDYEAIGAYAADHGMGTSALRILEGGKLTKDAGTVRDAMRFVLKNPAVSVALVGFSNASQVGEAARFIGT